MNQIIKGLNSAGFSKRDFRAADQTRLDLAPQPAVSGSDQQPEATPDGTETEEFLNFDETDVAEGLEQRGTSEDDTGEASAGTSGLATMLEQATQKGADYEQEAEQAAQFGDDFVPADLEDAVDTTAMISDFVDEVSGLKIPQFVIQTPPSLLFSTGEDGVLSLIHI